MNSKERFAYLKLALSQNVGPITFKELIKHFKTANQAVENILDFKFKSSKRVIKLAPDSLVHEQMEMAQKTGAQILFLADKEYPELLKFIDSAPPVLFLWGNKNLLKQKSISIVGSRNASLNGISIAKKIAYDLALKNVTVVSGLAKGIDKAAHEGALMNTSSDASTIAVLGTGVDVLYPKENQIVYDKIKERGLLISELPFGSRPTPSAFPRRNRIISGLSYGTLVVEASLMSGSLITAKEALSQGREIFAIPGSPLDSRAAGPNQLIQDGAHLVSSAENILNVIDSETSFKFFDSYIKSEQMEALALKVEDSEFDIARKTLLEKLSPQATHVDVLIRETGLAPYIVNTILMELEIAGKIERFAGQYVALIYNNEWDKE